MAARACGGWGSGWVWTAAAAAALALPGWAVAQDGSPLLARVVADAPPARAGKAGASPLAVPGCPDRGGILDSISVPVGQPLSLRVVLSAPAPRGGATFETSSVDPSIVAAGDRRQGFLPRVVVPEGQTQSNQFTLFGIKIGGTRLRLVGLTPGYGTSSFPLGAWDLNKGGNERFVDANPPSNSCRAGASLSTDPALLSRCGAPAKGLATDGVSRLLLRGASGLQGTMCFEVVSPASPSPGTISAPLVTTQRVGSLDYGFSTLLAPEAFESEDPFREVEIEATFTPSIGNGNTTRFRAKTRLVRPPVVLVHGVWSSGGAWGGEYIFNTPHRTTFAGDYAGTNGARFTTNSPRIRNFVAQALQQHRDKGFASTQADVLGHSMGGILTRMHVASAEFRRPENFDRGDVRRLITLNTPHSGSTFGNLVASLHAVDAAATNNAVNSITGFNPAGGAVCDLAENSPGLGALGASTLLPAVAITGTGGPAGTPAVPARFFGGLLGFGNIEGELTRTRCVRRNVFRICEEERHVFPQEVVDAFRFRQANDTIVPLSSQRAASCNAGGMANTNFAGVIHSGPGVVDGVLNVGAVATRALQFLDGPVNAMQTAFPAIGSTGLGVACTVPGRGAVQDAADYAGRCSAGGPLGRGAAARAAGTQALPGAVAPVAVPDARVQILSPAAGTVVAPGTTLAITVRVAEPLVANDITVQIPGFSTLPGRDYAGETYQASFSIPPDFAGPLRLTPVVTDGDNQTLAGAELVVAVRPAGPMASLALQQRNFRVPASGVGDSQPLALFGTDTAGRRFNLSSAAAGTAWVSSDDGVASVDAQGVVRLNGTGVAVVSATAFGLRDHAVFVVEDPASPLPPADLTARVGLVQSGLRLDRNTGFFVQTVTLTNRQPLPLAGPLALVISGLPAGVDLVSQSGVTQNALPGKPYLSVPLAADGLTLAPGQSIVFTLQYINTSRVPFGIVPSLWRVSAQP